MAYDGTIRIDARMDTSGFQQGANKLTDIVRGLGVFKLLEAGFQAVASSVDAAVSRYDTLNRFPKILQQMGFSAEESAAATDKLSAGIQGLPTTLDDVVSTAQRLTVLTGNLGEATDTTLALNNAFLASGSTSADASRGLQQYVQMLSSGKVDMQSWRTLQETMGYALGETAKAFGFAGESAQNDLYSALQSGQITFDAFNAKIIELNNGVGGFAELAKTSTGGIGTAWTNLQTGIVRGTTSIVEAIDTGLSSTRFKSIENIITTAGQGINKVFQSVSSVITPVVKNLDVLTVAVGGAVASFAATKIVMSFVTATNAVKTACQGAWEAGSILTVTTDKQAIAAARATAIQKLGTQATEKEILANMASQGVITTKTLALGGLTSGMGLATVATTLWGVATKALSAIFNSLGGVLGIALALLPLLVAGISAVIKWVSRGSEEYQKQKSEVEALSEKQKALADSMKESTAEAEKNVSAVEAEALAGQKLLSTLSTLTKENDGTAASHEAITQTVNDLNNAYDGLNLAYDEETGALSASVEEISEYIEKKNALSKMSVLDERRVELAKQQAEIEANLNEIEVKREIIEADATMSAREKNKLLKQLDKDAKAYGETQDALALDIKANNAAIEESTDSMAQNAVNRYEAINGAVTSGGQNLKQLAHEYDTTTEQILADMEAQGISMEEWAARKAEGFTSEGLSLDDIAAKWGMTSEEVQAHLEEWGISLDDFDKEMEDTHTSAGLTLDDLAAKWGTTTDEIKRQMAEQGITMQEWSDNHDAATQDVINSFQEIPEKYDKSADDLIKVLQTNAERYSTWTNNIATLSQTMSADAIAELQKLGPEANSAIEQMIADPSKAAEFEASVQAVMSAGANGAQVGADDPRYSQAGGQAEANIGGGVTESQETEAAMAAKVSSAADAANAAIDGGALDDVGDNIALKIVNGVSSADLSGISKSLGQAIMDGAAAVNTALGAMKAQMATQFTDMCSVAKISTTQMMNAIVSEINGQRSAAHAAAKAITEAVNNALKELIEKSRTVADRAMEAFMTGITTATPLAQATAKTMIGAVNTAATEAVADNNFSNIGLNIINGITLGVVNGTSGLVNAMIQAVDEAAAAAKKRAKINSPSHLFRDLIGLNIMKGWAQGIEQGEGLVVGGVEGTVSALEDSALNTLLAVPKVQMQGFVARMQAAVETRHAATAANIAAYQPEGRIAGSSNVDELLTNALSPLRSRGQQGGEIKLTVQAVLDGEKIYETVQRVGLERGAKITDGRFDYVR